MHYILLFLSVCLLAASCNQDSPSANVKNPVTETTTDILTAESLKTKPPTKIINSAFIPAFVNYVESTYCASQNKKGSECYKMHNASVKSDFLSKLPITLNFPYNGTFNWSGLLDKKGFSDYWSNKCGFMNEETGDVITFYCPNISGSTRPWLDSLATTNAFIAEFTNFYYDTQTILPNFQSNFILNNATSLDYSNIDHRAFYWMYHLGLIEESAAATKANEWK